MNRKTLIILILIIFLGSFLRLWKLDKYPVSLSIDEVAIGYNAFSIWHTGKDEFGTFMPLAFRSVGDYKPPVLIYLTSPFVGVFGLTEFTVRLPIALISILTLFIVYKLVYILTNNNFLSLFTTLSLAISPWHIHYSRASYEAILALFFVILGTWLFFYALNKKGKYLWISGISYILSAYSYHAERLFTPIFLLLLILLYGKIIIQYRKAVIITLVVMFFLSLPLVGIMLTNQGQQRANVTFITQDENISYLLHTSSEKLTFLQSILDNNYVIVGNFWLKRYLNYWDPQFLFFNGMNYTHPGMQGMGLFLLVELPFFALGLWNLFFKKVLLLPPLAKLLTCWLLLGPLAASFTNNEQHALRSLPVIPVPQLIIALGAYTCWQLLKKHTHRIKIVYLSLFIVIFGFNLFYWADQYFVHYPIHYSEYWDYGYKEAVLYAWDHYNEYPQIVIDNTFGSLGPYIVGTPHLYALFYGKYNLQNAQSERANYQENFGKFLFRTIYWPEDRFQPNTLYVGSPWRIPLKDVKENQILKKIYFKNGNLAFLIVKT